MRRSRSSSAVALSDRVRGSREGEITLLNAEPAVGSAPPSAGLSPAPSEKEIAKWLRRHFALRFFSCERPLRPPIPRPLLYGRGGRRAQPPGGEGSGAHHHCQTAWSLPCV